MTTVLRPPGGLDELRALDQPALAELAAQLRAELIESVCRTGGHLGPNLGMVELTLALHRVFRSPHDAIVFDTGHQSYVHKMLTGRRAELGSLRQSGGMSGYPSRAESVHDLVENSHASTALSYADGLAKAFDIRGESDRCVVAVVGDGALTGGMCWEALNNLGTAWSRPVVIVLNDNGRSYAPTVGGLAAHLARLRGGSGGAVFERLGLRYLGPIDGHDITAVQDALEQARDMGTPTVVHCLTRKGRGYLPAETDEADRMHAIAPPAPPAGPSWTSVFGAELAAIGAARPDVVAVTAAMLRPTGLHPFATAFPDRVHDVGIAEQHAVTSAAGLAMGGLHPVVAIYATFLNRAFDQVLLDVALHRLPVTLVLDRAGITGNDGPSHNGMWDLSILGSVPDMRVAAPRDAQRLRELLREAVADGTGPTVLRFPKGAATRELPGVGTIGTGDVLVHQPHAEVLLIGVGAMASVAVDPVLVAAARQYRLVVSIEDNGVAGGYGDAFCRAARGLRVRTEVQTLGLAQQFLPHGARGNLLAAQGLDPPGIVASALRRLGSCSLLQQDRHRIAEVESIPGDRGW